MVSGADRAAAQREQRRAQVRGQRPTREPNPLHGDVAYRIDHGAKKGERGHKPAGRVEALPAEHSKGHQDQRNYFRNQQRERENSIGNLEPAVTENRRIEEEQDSIAKPAAQSNQSGDARKPDQFHLTVQL